MFESITKNFGGIIEKLRGRRFISEEDFETALREIRIAMLEADVSLPVIREFIKRVKDKVVGEEVIKKVSPGQMIVKIINDEFFAIIRVNAHFNPLFIYSINTARFHCVINGRFNFA